MHRSISFLTESSGRLFTSQYAVECRDLFCLCSQFCFNVRHRYPKQGSAVQSVIESQYLIISNCSSTNSFLFHLRKLQRCLMPRFGKLFSSTQCLRIQSKSEKKLHLQCSLYLLIYFSNCKCARKIFQREKKCFCSLEHIVRKFLP